MEVKSAGANLEAYQALANEGVYMKKDGDGDGVHATGKSGKLGEVTKWLAKRNAGDNRELKQQFLDDIRHTFGSDFAEKVKGDINPEGRSPLSANKINRVFAQARNEFGDSKVDAKIGSSPLVVEFTNFEEGSELRKLIQTADPAFYATGSHIDNETATEGVAYQVAEALEAATEKKGSTLTPVEAAELTRKFVFRELDALPATPQPLADCLSKGDIPGARDRVAAAVAMVNASSISESIGKGIEGKGRLMNQMLEGVDDGMRRQLDPLVKLGSDFNILAITQNADAQAKLTGFIEANENSIQRSDTQFAKNADGSNSQAFLRLKNNPLTELTAVFAQITTRIPLQLKDLASAADAYASDPSQSNLRKLRGQLDELKNVSTIQQETIACRAAAIQVPGFIESAPEDTQPFLRETATTLIALNSDFAADGGILSDLQAYADSMLASLPPLAPRRSDV